MSKLRKISLTLLLLGLVSPLVAQIAPKKADSLPLDSGPVRVSADTTLLRRQVDTTLVSPQLGRVALDTIVVDTVVTRRPQQRVGHLGKGVVLSSSLVSLKKTRPLDKSYAKYEAPEVWQKINLLGLNISEAAFVNWNAGGNSSIAALANARFERNYKYRYIQWANALEMRYGLNLQDGQGLRKTDDAFRVSSTFGYRRDTIGNWYYSAKAKFNTQFSNGFKYPDRSAPVSRFMAPGYFFLGAGTSYIAKERQFNLYASPLTLKTTFVLDRNLANKGAFGVSKAVLDAEGNVLEPGKRVFLELGFLITNSWESQVYKNMGLKHRLSLYTDYLRRFGNVDIDWELNVELRVNEYIMTTLGTHIIYDDDILFGAQTDDAGQVVNPGSPRLQFKQLLGVGVSYNF